MLCAPCSAVVILIEIIIAHLLGQTLLFSLSRPSSVPIKFSMKSNLLLLVDTFIGFYWYLWIIDSHKQRRNKKDTMNSSHLSPPEAVTSNLKFLGHIRKTFPLSQLLRQARGNENPFILTRIYKGQLEEWASYPCWNGMCHSKSTA